MDYDGARDVDSKPFASVCAGVMLFGRLPRLKRVKSRLAAGIGEQKALRSYQVMWSMMLGLLRRWRFGPRVVCYTGGRWCLGDGDIKGFEIRRQRGTGFGARLEAAIKSCLKRYGMPFLVIGSDCPTLSLHDLERAARCLNEYDLVLGPSTDGGVYLLGLRSFKQDLFAKVAWSTHTVCRDLERNAEDLGWRFCRLKAKQDVDSHEDLTRLMERWPLFGRRLETSL